ncbi:MAG: hypothetical protein ACLFP7_09065 [Thiohalospira sp.]
MPSEDLLSQLGHWAGYHVTEVQREAATGDQPATIRVKEGEPDEETNMQRVHIGSSDKPVTEFYLITNMVARET